MPEITVPTSLLPSAHKKLIHMLANHESNADAVSTLSAASVEEDTGAGHMNQTPRLEENPGTENPEVHNRCSKRARHLMHLAELGKFWHFH